MQIINRMRQVFGNFFRGWYKFVTTRKSNAATCAVVLGSGVLICFVLSFVIGITRNSAEAIGLIPTRTPTTVPTATSIPTSTAIPTSTPIPTDTAVPEDTPLPTATAEPTAEPLPTPQPSIGQDIDIAGVRWKILEAYDAGATLPSSNQFIRDATTNGKFIRVRIEIENRNSDSVGYDGFKIVDNKDRTFDEWHVIQSNAFVPDEEDCGTYVSLVPNIPQTCQLIFEVAKDADGFKAKIYPHEIFTWETSVEVDLGF